MKGNVKFAVAISLLLACLCLTLASCGGSKSQKVIASDMSTEALEECVELCEYKNIELSTEGKAKQDVLIAHIMKNSSIVKYPEGAVEYYVEQLEEQYEYYADQIGMKYEDMLKELGENDATIIDDARELVKQDLVLELIRRRENITLTDADKSDFFDKYVEKYADNYGYSEEYVRENLSESVYSSMIYDKTMEFLIINNQFIEETPEQTEQ